MTAAELASLPQLRARRVGRDRYMARCPAHDDRRESLSIRQGERGVILYDFAGCRTADVVRALGLNMSSLFDGPPPSPEQMAAKAREDTEREQAARARRWAHGAACSELLKWERISDELGAKLARLSDDDPAGEELARLFHLSVRRGWELETTERELRHQ